MLNITLKLTFKRARPTPFFDLLPPETYSFPSGHSLASCCFFGALAAILTARIKSKRVRAIVWIVASVMFLSIGFSTNLSRRASHYGRDRRICGGVDLDPGGEICGDAVGEQKEKKD